MKKVFTTALLSTMVLGGVLATSQTVNADQDGTPGVTLLHKDQSNTSQIQIQ